MNQENEEIGELLNEIISKGFGDLQTDVNDTGPFRTVSVRIGQSIIDPFHPQNPLDGKTFEGNCLVEVLCDVVNAIRRERGEPTLEEGVLKMLEEEEAHAHELIHCGPDARCACGSATLLVEKTVKFGMAVNLRDGELCFIEKPKTLMIEDGETARCPVCLKWYRLNATEAG